MTADQFSYEYHYVNGVTLHVGHMGPASGEIIIFLHGFPEFSYGWIKQARFLSERGFHVIAPDQRGYNLSKKPGSVSDYSLDILARDILTLIEKVCRQPVTVVGHDWGGAVAWQLAQIDSILVKNLIILNMPHPMIMQTKLGRNPRQMLRSWYVFFFQLPYLPEKVISAFNFKWLEKMLVTTAQKGKISYEYILTLRKAWRQPKAITSMINWYRFFLRSPSQTGGPIQVPTLIIWGAKDTFLETTMAEQSIDQCLDGKLIILEDASHWLHHEQTQLVNHYILKFIEKDKLN